MNNGGTSGNDSTNMAGGGPWVPALENEPEHGDRDVQPEEFLRPLWVGSTPNDPCMSAKTGGDGRRQPLSDYFTPSVVYPCYGRARFRPCLLCYDSSRRPSQNANTQPRRHKEKPKRGKKHSTRWYKHACDLNSIRIEKPRHKKRGTKNSVSTTRRTSNLEVLDYKAVFASRDEIT